MPIIFFATSNMDFNAIARTKGDTLEIDKIQLNQAGARATATVGRTRGTCRRRRHRNNARIMRTVMFQYRLCGEISGQNPHRYSVFRQSVGDNAV